jgi:hypothetical protein
MHLEQIKYCESIKEMHSKHFENKNVLDVGSMDINGNNRYLFSDCDYLGLDIGEGKNVDVVCQIHKFKSNKFDTIISTEMLEHDKHWKESLLAMYNLLKVGGLLMLTAASTNRKEHGTTRTDTFSSPFTTDYYKNITTEMLNEVLKDLKYKTLEITVSNSLRDIGFILIK